jgi:hypothetical protein
MGTRSAVKATEKALQCPICLDEFTAPVTTHCGHRFCEGCIKRALQEKKECPQCRQSITSHRTLRSDTTLQMLTDGAPANAMDAEFDAAGEVWSCKVCTLSNPVAAARCQACGSRRPAPTLAPSDEFGRAFSTVPLSKVRSDVFGGFYQRPRSKRPRDETESACSNAGGGAELAQANTGLQSVEANPARGAVSAQQPAADPDGPMQWSEPFECPELGPGWTKRSKPRRAGGTKVVDTVWFSPSGQRFRSGKQAQEHLSATQAAGAQAAGHATTDAHKEDDVPCTACGWGDDSFGNEIVLCDTAGCTGAYHLLCLPQPLSAVPDNEWFCPKCCGVGKMPSPAVAAAAGRKGKETVRNPKKKVKEAAGHKAMPLRSHHLFLAPRPNSSSDLQLPSAQVAPDRPKVRINWVLTSSASGFASSGPMTIGTQGSSWTGRTREDV